jgi:hypothetical protein
MKPVELVEWLCSQNIPLGKSLQQSEGQIRKGENVLTGRLTFLK